MREQFESKTEQSEACGNFAKELESLNKFHENDGGTITTFSYKCDAFLSWFCCG